MQAGRHGIRVEKEWGERWRQRDGGDAGMIETVRLTVRNEAMVLIESS